MQELGNYLERLGPAFGVLFYALVIGVGVSAIILALAALFADRRQRRQHAHPHHV